MGGGIAGRKRQQINVPNSQVARARRAGAKRTYARSGRGAQCVQVRSEASSRVQTGEMQTKAMRAEANGGQDKRRNAAVTDLAETQEVDDSRFVATENLSARCAHHLLARAHANIRLALVISCYHQPCTRIF